MPIDLFAILPTDDEGAAGRLAESGVHVSQMPLFRLRRTRSASFWLLAAPRLLRDVLAVARLVSEQHVEIVESSSVNLHLALGARLGGARVIWRTADISSPLIVRRLVGRLLPSLADAVLVNGEALVAEYPGVERSRVFEVYYPMINEPSVRNVRETGRPVVVGSVANVNPDKGIDVFVEAAALVAAQSPVRFVHIGSEHRSHAKYARGVHLRVSELALTDSFRFYGPRADVAACLADMDVFVVSSRREGSTTTILEAMAACLPVVATDVGAIAEVVAHGVTGLLVPAGSPAALADAISRLVDDPGLRYRMAAAGRARYEREFGAAAAVSRRVELYKRIALWRS